MQGKYFNSNITTMKQEYNNLQITLYNKNQINLDNIYNEHEILVNNAKIVTNSRRKVSKLIKEKIEALRLHILSRFKQGYTKIRVLLNIELTIKKTI